MREMKTAMSGADILIVGGGIIGMSVALELRTRGAEVLVLERAGAGERVRGMASWAAAGMIAADDPYNPVGLQPLSSWSAGLYDDYLQEIERAGGGRVQYQTQTTRQYLGDGRSLELRERSLDPRELFAALRGAVGNCLRQGVAVNAVLEDERGVVAMSDGDGEIRATKIVWANGAWAAPWMKPRKGQMLRMRLPRPMEMVHRAEHVYVVPRTHGEQAGTALIGATVEDAGFDVSVNDVDLESLRGMAAALVPEVRGAEIVESWAGLRPASGSGLPVMGYVPGSERQMVCGGHFRNGVLLAPASAKVMVDLADGVQPMVDLSAFAVEKASFAHGGR